jgi:hypothetical protein
MLMSSCFWGRAAANKILNMGFGRGFAFFGKGVKGRFYGVGFAPLGNVM